MPANTQISGSFLAIHQGVATLPVPTSSSDGVAVPVEWMKELSSSILLRFSIADAAMSLANVQVAVQMEDAANPPVLRWYKLSPILNGGTAIVLTEIGYAVQVPVILKSAKRIAVVGTPTGTGLFTVDAAVIKTQY